MGIIQKRYLKMNTNVAIGINSQSHFEISTNTELKILDDINWLKDFRKKVEKEEKLRSDNPALADIWESYQTMLRIVMDDV
jgi:hypothetical protein